MHSFEHFISFIIVTVGGATAKQRILELHKYFAFGIKGDSESPQYFPITIDRFKKSTSSEKDEFIRIQLFEIWKNNDIALVDVPLVRFCNEPAVGRGVKESYLNLIREHVFLNY